MSIPVFVHSQAFYAMIREYNYQHCILCCYVYDTLTVQRCTVVFKYRHE